MKHPIILYSLMAVSAALGLSACHDDDRVFGAPVELSTPLVLSLTEVEASYEGRYYCIDVTAADSLWAVRASSDAGWIQLDVDTLSRSGSFLFYVTPNDSARRREAAITFRLGNNPLTATLFVRQRSEAEENSNALVGDSISRKARVGYGYNMLIDFMDPKSVTEPIFDYSRIVAAEVKWGTIIGEEGRSLQELNIHSSYSIEEMSSWLSEQQSTETDILFSNKTVEKYKQVSEYELDQQTYGYSSLSKIVATRYVDEGKIESVIRQGEDIFTDAFRELYDQVNTSPTDDNVRQLVNRFGTHLVTYADLGGRLDYMVNFRSEETSRESVEKYMKYKNGKLQESKESNEAMHSICSSGGLTFDIYGGTERAIRDLQTNANTADRYGQVNQSLLGNWLNSVSVKDPGSVSLVRCHLQPIWQLFTNEGARARIISHILQLSYSLGGEVGARLQELGLDNYYRFSITDAMRTFKDDAGTTLVRLAYFDGIPKVEICNEYVPELRGDRRVTIFYPIYKQQANIRRGVFPGDGENPPSEVTFDNEGGCYVRPLEGYQVGDILHTLYYIDGAFYPDGLGLDVRETKMILQDEWMTLNGSFSYPVVKIGPGYWTRKNISNEMKFGISQRGRFVVREKLMDGQLYAQIFGDNQPLFLSNNASVYGKATDEISGLASLWFLPLTKDKEHLMAYLGQNPKAMFKKQQSGFDADFMGYYGMFDPQTGMELDETSQRDKGALCYVAFKKEVGGTEGEVLVLTPNYTWKSCSITSSHNNWYPVRLFRTSRYKHLNLK